MALQWTMTYDEEHRMDLDDQRQPACQIMIKGHFVWKLLFQQTDIRIHTQHTDS